MTRFRIGDRPRCLQRARAAAGDVAHNEPPRTAAPAAPLFFKNALRVSLSLLVMSLFPHGVAGVGIENHPAVAWMVGEPDSVQQVTGANIEGAAADPLTA